MATRQGGPPPALGPAVSRRGRRVGSWGWVFVVLLLLGAGMASVPGGDDATSTVRDFYTRHTGVVAVAQVVGLLAALAFVPFALGLTGAVVRRPARPLDAAGLAVAAAAVLTVVPVLWLTAVADTGSDELLHRLAVASDLVDVLLFTAIACWAAALLRDTRPRWVQGLAGVVALLALARAVLLLAGSSALELVSPMGFVTLVAVTSTLALLGRSPVRG